MKKGHWKYVCKTIFSLCMVLQCGIPVIAENNTDTPAPSAPSDITETTSSQEQSLNPETYLSDTNDQLLQKYLDSRLKNLHVTGRTIRYSKRRGTNLKGLNLAVYNQLKEKIDQVVQGNITDTDFQLDINYDKNGFTPEDLGIDSSDIIANPDRVYSALDKKYPGLYTLDGNAVFEALLADEPYELYWLDKTAYNAVSWENPSYMGDTEEIFLIGRVKFSMKVNLEYRQDPQDPYKISSSKVSSINQSIRNVDSIINAAEGKSDYEKLLYYHDEVDSRVSYDEDAAYNNSYSENNSPWSVINVFDDDQNTNAVCEGYAKAFKYLCDLTRFNSGLINVYTVTGTMNGGGHMWNVAQMDDGKVYLVDPTLDDEGSIAYPHELFLVGTENGDYKNGYTISLTTETMTNSAVLCPNQTASDTSAAIQTGWDTADIRYRYDNETLSLYSADELTLNHKNYDPSAPKATVQPAATPVVEPTAEPTTVPTKRPAPKPAKPTSKPTPVVKPTQQPTSKPAAKPTQKPTVKPTSKPAVKPTVKPTAKPTIKPTAKPTSKPTAKPSSKPTAKPVSKPTSKPTAKPTGKPAVEKTVTMYRAYNPNSGEHFYTKNKKEFNHIVSLGWRNEGVGWIAPESSRTPVYRLYNANGGEHHYTLSSKEKNALIKAGWKDEGIGWYSDNADGVPLYREYNPNAFANNHNYTASKKENDTLVKLGWKYEGIGWYGVRNK